MFVIGRFFLFFLLTFVFAQVASATIVQSEIVSFPAFGRVIVQAQQEINKYPQLVFIAEKTGKVLYRNSIQDKERWLIQKKDSELTPPDFRFRVIYSPGFRSPMIMSVGLSHGGSDAAFFLTLFGERQGRIRRLNPNLIDINIQGGFYLGYLNKKLGYGLAVWDFIWEYGDEAHYSEHRYSIDIYQLQGNNFKRIIRRSSRNKYGKHGEGSLWELGLKARDQRTEIPVIKDNLD